MQIHIQIQTHSQAHTTTHKNTNININTHTNMNIWAALGSSNGNQKGAVKVDIWGTKIRVWQRRRQEQDQREPRVQP